MALQLQSLISYVVSLISPFSSKLRSILLNRRPPFYLTYFQTFDAISRNDGNYLKLAQIRLQAVLLLAEAFHYIWLFKSQHNHSSFVNALHFNVVSLMRLPDFLSLYLALFNLLTFQSLRFLYFKHSGLTYTLLRELLLEEKKPDFFLKAKYKFGAIRKLCLILLKADINKAHLWRNAQCFAGLIKIGLDIFFALPLCKYEMKK